MGPLAIPILALWWIELGAACGSDYFNSKCRAAAGAIIREANPEWWPTVEA
jgi:hypothetical protein